VAGGCLGCREACQVEVVRGGEAGGEEGAFGAEVVREAWVVGVSRGLWAQVATRTAHLSRIRALDPVSLVLPSLPCTCSHTRTANSACASRVSTK